MLVVEAVRARSSTAWAGLGFWASAGQSGLANHAMPFWRCTVTLHPLSSCLWQSVCAFEPWVQAKEVLSWWVERWGGTADTGKLLKWAQCGTEFSRPCGKAGAFFQQEEELHPITRKRGHYLTTAEKAHYLPLFWGSGSVPLCAFFSTKSELLILCQGITHNLQQKSHIPYPIDSGTCSVYLSTQLIRAEIFADFHPELRRKALRPKKITFLWNNTLKGRCQLSWCQGAHCMEWGARASL